MTITVGDLIRQLNSFPADADLTFAGGLNFHRLKTRGPMLVQVEFSENVYQTEAGKWIVEAPALPAAESA